MKSALVILALASIALAQTPAPRKSEEHKPEHKPAHRAPEKPRAGGPAYFNAGGKAAAPSAYTRVGTAAFVPPVTFSGDLTGNTTTQTVIGLLGQPLPALTVGYIYYNGTNFVFQTPSGGGGGGMTWPGAVGIANYAGGNTWGTSYNNTTNPIPPGYNQFLTLGTSTSGGTKAAPALNFSAAPELGLFVGPLQFSGGALQGFPISTLTRTSNVVTVVAQVGSMGLPVGATIQISGVADSSFNGVFQVASISGNTLTYNQSVANASSTGGVISPWMLNVAGYGLEFSHLQSNSNGYATRGSIRLGPADPIMYGCAGCGQSVVSGLATSDQNLITPQSSTGPVLLGDTMGVTIPGALTVGSVSGNLTLSSMLGSGGPFCLQQTNGVVSTTTAACGTGAGSGMVWPPGTGPFSPAVIPAYTGSSSWATSYSASNPIPASFIPNSLTSSTTGNAATATALAPPVAGTANQVWAMNSSATQQLWVTPTSSGVVNSANQFDIAYYAATGQAVSGSNGRFTDNGSTLTYNGTGHFQGTGANLQIDGLLQVAGPWLVTTIVPTGSTMGPAPSGPPVQSSFGISGDGNFYISANGTPISIICTPLNGACASSNMPSGNSGDIPSLSGTGTWGTSYSSSVPIPATMVAGTTGNAATATALATAPLQCAAGSYARGINASGTAQNCTVAFPATSVASDLAINSGVLTTVGHQPYEIALTVNGTFTTSQVFLRKPTSLQYTIPAGCTNSQITLLTNPANSSTTFTITLAKNGISFATAAVSTGGVVTWTCASATTFVVGSDVLTVTAPSTVDTAAAGLGASIYATR